MIHKLRLQRPVLRATNGNAVAEKVLEGRNADVSRDLNIDQVPEFPCNMLAMDSDDEREV